MGDEFQKAYRDQMGTIKEVYRNKRSRSEEEKWPDQVSNTVCICINLVVELHKKKDYFQYGVGVLEDS